MKTRCTRTHNFQNPATMSNEQLAYNEFVYGGRNSCRCMNEYSNEMCAEYNRRQAEAAKAEEAA